MIVYILIRHNYESQSEIIGVYADFKRADEIRLFQESIDSRYGSSFEVIEKEVIK